VSAGKLLEKTMMQKFGPAEVNDHFMSFNTICDATQVRQCECALVTR
jgi:4-hydroxy-3-methylbut-2-enyl diphosphate reductase